jgi:SNF2 family DNA or RNA helicase
MDARDSDDPFDWDVPRVIQELCTPDRSWKPSCPHKSPDSTRLKKKLYELQVDGQSLLTYEGEDFPLNDLLTLLEIKVLPHRLFIGEAIRKFKIRSVKYRQWKREQAGELIHQPGVDHTVRPEATAKEIHSEPNSEDISALQSDPSGLATTLKRKLDTHQPLTLTTGVPAAASRGGDEVQQSSVPEQSLPCMANHSVSPETLLNQQPSSKKRRIATTLLSTVPINTVPIPVANASDELSKVWTGSVLSNTITDLRNTTPGDSYLRCAGLPLKDIGPDMSSDDESSDNTSLTPYVKKGPKEEFSFVKPDGKRHPGTERQVYNAVKRYLMGKLTVDGGADIHGYGAEVLGPFGESDSEYDTEELEEYRRDVKKEKEEALKQTKKAQPAFLLPEEVEAAIEEAVQEYKDRWTEEKLPIQMLRANKMWNDARRYKIRNSLMSKAARFLRQLDSRIIGQKKQLVANQWSDKASLRKQMKDSLQPSIRDRMAEELRYQILSSPMEPKKPKNLPRPTILRKEAPVVSENEDSEVILDSDEEEDLSQFIVDDSVEDDQMDADDGMPDAVDDSMDIDGQSDSGQVVRHERQTSATSSEGNARAPDTFSPTVSAVVETDLETPLASVHDIEPVGEDLGLVNGAGQDVSTPPADETMDHDIMGNGEVNAESETNGQWEPIMSSQSPKTGTIEPHSALEAREQTFVADYDSPSQGFPAEIQPQPSSDDITAIANMGVDYWSIEHWENEVDNQRGLLIALLYGWPVATREKMFEAVEGPEDMDTLWDLYVDRAMKVAQTARKFGRKAKLGFALVQLFLSWLDRRPFVEQYTRVPSLTPLDCERISTNKSLLNNFRQHVQSLIPGFRELEPGQSPEEDSKAASSQGRASGSAGLTVASNPEETGDQIAEQAPIAVDAVHAPPVTPKSAGTFAEKIEAEAADSDDSDDMPISSARKKRKRVVRNREAADLRENVFQEEGHFEERRRALRETLARSGHHAGHAARFIINETKQDKHGLVYVNPSIAMDIKPHQVDGVRFMWDRIVAMDKQSRQGCLLAHTMGLGKTMQVITLLYAIAEASSSEDKAIKSQIPKNLRDGKILILCPAGLVDNWHDEFIKWTPKPTDSDKTSPPLGLLGHLYKIDAAHPNNQRETIIRRWARTRGVLIMGYEMLRTFLKKSAPGQDHGYASDTSSDTWALLTQEPSVVVADEAHKLKNPNSQVNAAVSNFRTQSRIALTGTPLANNVSDYYSMIHWCAPNFLGPAEEFKTYFEAPIKDGLWADDAPAERKFALKRLSVLKSTVSPLVHRMSILALKDDLPQKKEFVLYLDWTPMQRKAYSTFLKCVVHNPEAKDMITGGNTMWWDFVRYLGSILAHPSIYGKKLLDKPPENRKKPAKYLGLGDGGVGSGDDENALRIPHHILKKLVATTPKSADGTWNYEDSRKLAVLTRILDECRRVRDKVLVFTHHLATLDFLEAMFVRQKRNYFRLDGRTTISSRQGATKKFNQDGDAEIYLISTKAGGVGLNIQGANRVVIFDFLYVPMEEQQAIGRAYRIGQEKPVFVYWLIVGGTFEESIQNRSVFKMQLQSRVLDKKNPLPWAQRNKSLFPLPREVEQHDLSEFSGRDAVLDAVLGSPVLQGSVRKIIATEAFEEEVKDDELSAEDRKEIENTIAQRQFQRENPGATALCDASLPMPPSFSQMGQAGPAQPNPVPYGQGRSGCKSPATTAFKPGSKSAEVLTRPLKISVPQPLWTNPNLRQTTVEPQADAQPPRGLQPVALPSTDTSLQHFEQPRTNNFPLAPPVTNDVLGSASETHPPLPLPSATNVSPAPFDAYGVVTDAVTRRANAIIPQPVAAGAPIAAPGTQMRNPESTTPPQAPTARAPNQLSASATQAAPSTSQAIPPATQAPPSTGRKVSGFSVDPSVIQDKQSKVKELLMNAYGSYEAHAFRDILTPDEVAAAVSKAIGAETQEYVVVVAFYTTLIKCLDASARFQKAMICGAIGAEALASLSRKDLNALVDKFDEMDESEFKKEIAKGIQKTSVRPSRHDDSDHDSNGGSNKSDKLN